MVSPTREKFKIDGRHMARIRQIAKENDCTQHEVMYVALANLFREDHKVKSMLNREKMIAELNSINAELDEKTKRKAELEKILKDK